MKIKISRQTDNLYKAILSLKNIEESRKFFRDLLTEEEISEFSARWRVASLLDKKVSYSKIEKQTGMSSTTIARISKWLNSGCNGYKLILKRLHHHQSKSRLRED